MVAKTINIPIPILNLTYDFENDFGAIFPLNKTLVHIFV